MTNLSGTNLNNGVAVGPQGEGMDSPSNVSTYPAYKDSGVEWLGEVPEGWTVSKLGYFFREPPCYGVLVPDFDPDGVPMLRITDMEHEFIDASGLVTISPSLSAQYARTIVQVGDVVLSLVGTIGKAFEISPKLAGVNLSRAVARIQLGSNTLPRYLCWIFQSREFTHFIDLVCKGTAQRVLNLSDLNAFSFTFPSYSEQCAISRFLDHETARIDALIEEQQRLIELLKEKRQAVISHAVTKGLDPTVPMKDSGVEWLGEVPEHWSITPLKFSASCNDTVLLESTDDDYEIEYVEISDVNEISGITGSASYKFSDAPSRARRMLQDGDVLISTVRTYLRAIAPVANPPENLIASTGFAVVRPRKGILDGAFLGYLLRAEWWISEVIARSVGVSYPAINASDLIGLNIPVPALHEQTQIARFLDHETVRIDSLISEAVIGVGLLQERRSALISAAVTGKIDVRGWQPTASVQAPELEEEAV